MKKNNNHINKEIDQILLSGSKEESVNTSPFFTTRVMGKVEQLEDSNVWFPKISLVLKPVLVLLVIVNVVNFYIYNQTTNIDTSSKSEVELAYSEYFGGDDEFIFSDDITFVN